METVIIGFIKVYQTVFSPLFGPCCRFHPSCSEYAIDAVRQHGALRGLLLTTKRLVCCQPFHPGGYDPVPGREQNQT